MRIAMGYFGKESLTETHLGCGESVAEATATPVSAAEAPGGCASELVVEVESGLEIDSRVAVGGGTADSSLMMHKKCPGPND